jgi:hypothetical protein
MPKLYMLLIGCTPSGRHTEQHDVFFSIADHVSEVLPHAAAFWPEANGSLHLDGWREVTVVNGFSISVVKKEKVTGKMQLFFINLGGYKQDEFEEFHYKMLVAAADKGEAVRLSKKTAFFRHTGFKGADAHIDDKYGVAVDDVYKIDDILPASLKEGFALNVEPASPEASEDEIHLGYFIPERVHRWAPRKVE